MEVTKKTTKCIMWGVILQVKGAKKSTSNFRLNVPGLCRSVSKFITSLLEVKMEVTKKTMICIVQGVFLWVKGAKNSKYKVKMNDQGLWRSFEFLTSSMEVKMEVTQKTKICVMWGVFLWVKGAKKSKSNFRLNVPGHSGLQAGHSEKKLSDFGINGFLFQRYIYDDHKTKKLGHLLER